MWATRSNRAKVKFSWSDSNLIVEKEPGPESAVQDGYVFLAQSFQPRQGSFKFGSNQILDDVARTLNVPADVTSWLTGLSNLFHPLHSVILLLDQ